MRTYTVCFRLFLALALQSVALLAYSEGVSIVVNENNNQEITQGFVKSIYSDSVFEWKNGNKITLYELPVNSDSREQFAKSVLNTSASDAQSEWSNRAMSNTIKNKPKIKSEKLVARLVAKDKNAIGYVSESIAKNTKGIKIVLTVQ